MDPKATLITQQGIISVYIEGDWLAKNASLCEAEVARILALQPSARVLSVDVAQLGHLDTLGSWLISKLRKGLEARGIETSLHGASADYQTLFTQVNYQALPQEPPQKNFVFADLVARLGAKMLQFKTDMQHGLAFFGHFMIVLSRAVSGKSRFRWPDFVNQLERIALDSVPIIALISFLVGSILAQQSLFQLQNFGSAAFVADLMGLLVLRELGVLLAAIMLAGRSGSSITAEIGSMKMREEVDALQTMGLDPIEVLAMPRIMALVVGLPMLTFISSMAGLFGGGLVALLYGGVSVEVYLSRLQNIIGLNTFFAGLIKAPFMALVIGFVACIEGLKVKGSAESLGAHTTDSVVKSIFMVIVVDGLFAMFFAAIKY